MMSEVTATTGHLPVWAKQPRGCGDDTAVSKSCSSSRPRWTKGPQYRLFLAAIVACLYPGCHRGEHGLDPRTRPATLLCRGWNVVSPDGASIYFVSDRGDERMIGSWEGTEKRFRWKSIGVVHPFGIQLLPDSRVLVIGIQKRVWEASAPQDWRELWFVDVDTLDMQKRLKAVDGPAVFRFTTPDTVVMPCWEEPEKEPRSVRLALWRVEGASLREIDAIPVSRRDYRVTTISQLARSTILVHLVFCNVAEQPMEQHVGNATRGREKQWEGELVLYDLSTRRIAGRAPTPDGYVVVADGGRYGALLGQGGIELRALPSLALLKKSGPRDYQYYEGAVSSDGRYVAFGLERLELWDTDANKVELLDEMDSKVILSDTFRHRDDPVGDDVFGRVAAQDQHCLACLRFIGESHRLAAVSHGGIFSLWDVSKRNRLRRDRMATVEYVGVTDPAISANRALGDVLADLRSGDEIRVTRATRQLVTRIPEKPDAEIAEALENVVLSQRNDFPRGDAAKALEKWSTPANVPGLIKAVDDKDALVRFSAIKALTKYKTQEAIGPISTSLDDVFTRNVAANFLKAAGPAAEPAVIKLLENLEPAVRKEAASVLKVIGTKQCIPALEKTATSDPNGFVKHTAQEALAAVKGREK